VPEDGGLIGQALIGLKPVNTWVHTYTKPQTSSTRSRGLGWRIHESVEDTKLSTNKQHTLSDDVALAAFLRQRAGFKATPGETFKEGPGGLGVFARLFDAVLRVATTCMVGRLYGLSEDLGLANFLGAFEGHELALARTALADTPASDQAAFRLHGALLSLLHAIFRPGHPSCGGRHVTSLCFRKDVARAGRSLCCFLTCNTEY